MIHQGLDPAWYYSAPGLAWDSGCKITKVQLELISDPDMLLVASEEESQQYHTDILKPTTNIWELSSILTKDSKFISYLDTNDLYGWAISKQLPTSGLKWMTDDEFDDWKHLSCFLEVQFLVSLEYPEDLHDLQNDYPLAPERVKIGNIEKLIPNLNNKTIYVVHNENLKLYESLGLKLPSLLTITNELLWPTEYTLYLTKIQT